MPCSEDTEDLDGGQGRPPSTLAIGSKVKALIPNYDEADIAPASWEDVLNGQFATPLGAYSKNSAKSTSAFDYKNLPDAPLNFTYPCNLDFSCSDAGILLKLSDRVIAQAWYLFVQRAKFKAF